MPLASGLLTGKMKPSTRFDPEDHRNYNRHGESFDRGETFSGVDYETGLKAVSDLEALLPESTSLVELALRWILMFDAVSCAIPGAKRPSQVEENVQSAGLPPIPDDTMKKIRAIYDQQIRSLVHHYW